MGGGGPPQQTQIILSDNYFDESQHIAADISALLSAGSYQDIVFPANKVWTLETNISIQYVVHGSVDFNGCEFVLPDNVHFNPDGDWDNIAVKVSNVSDYVINNLRADGNRLNNLGNENYGLSISGKSWNIVVNNAYLHDMAQCSTIVGANTHGIVFNGLHVKDTIADLDMYKACDIYVENLVTDDVSFHDSIGERKYGEGIAQQMFYINGYNTLINGVTVSGICGPVVDYRKGTHILRNMTCDHVDTLVISQVGSDQMLTIENLVGTDLDKSSSGRHTGVYMNSCASANISNVSISTTRTTKDFGLRLTGNAHNVTVSNLTVVGTNSACIYMAGLTETSYMTDVTLDPYLGSAITIVSTSAYQYIDGLTLIEPAPISDSGGWLVVT